MLIKKEKHIFANTKAPDLFENKGRFRHEIKSRQKVQLRCLMLVWQPEKLTAN